MGVDSLGAVGAASAFFGDELLSPNDVRSPESAALAVDFGKDVLQRPSPGGCQFTRIEPKDALPEPINVAGLWVWSHRSTLPDGDERQESEEWHLSQDGAELSGYYNRSLRQISTDGQAYRCNMATEFRITTRYEVRGKVIGDHFELSEQGFQVLEASRCDTGQRVLDTYSGQTTGDQLKLSWPTGSQRLVRGRPRDIPTLRF